MPWTKDDIQTLKAMTRDQHTIGVISRCLNKPSSDVRLKSRELRCRMKRESWSKEEWQDLYDQLLGVIRDAAKQSKPMPTNEELAKLLYVSPTSISRAIKHLWESKKIEIMNPNTGRIVLVDGMKTAKQAIRNKAWIVPKSEKDSDEVEKAKTLLRRVGYNPVYNAQIVHPYDKNKRGKFCVGTKLIGKRQLLKMAAESKESLAA